MTKAEIKRSNTKKKDSLMGNLSNSAILQVVSCINEQSDKKNFELRVRYKGKNIYIVLHEYESELRICFFVGGQIKVETSSSMFYAKEDFGNIFDFYQFVGDEPIDDKTMDMVEGVLNKGIKELIEEYFKHDAVPYGLFYPCLEEIFPTFLRVKSTEKT